MMTLLFMDQSLAQGRGAEKSGYLLELQRL